MKTLRDILVGFILGSISLSFAATISSPPPIANDPILYHYLYEIYENINAPRVVTTAPNGNIRGVDGEQIIYNNSGTYELWVKDNVSTTSWQRIN